MSSYYNPSPYGINDVTIPEGSGSFGARIYYPSDEMEVRDVPYRDGIYPLVAFAHGERASDRSLCPPDVTADYKKWGAVLHLLARCGFVVISPAMDDVLNDTTQAAVRMETAIAWARSSWPSRQIIHQPPVFYLDPDGVLAQAPEQKQESLSLNPSHLARLGHGFGFDHQLPLGPPTSLGLVGHSWGARAAAIVAGRGNVEVKAVTSIAGSWDANDAISALIDSALPTLMIAGTDDTLNLSYLHGLWGSLAIPKHQAMMQGLGHWDWFGFPGSIYACNVPVPSPAQQIGWQATSELVLAFTTKYLLNNWWRPPYLLGSPGGRPPFLGWFSKNGPCAMSVRWNDPMSSSSLGQVGDITVGNWTSLYSW
ncbi:alpha/beta hydrolase [Rhizobium leguminosarum]|uniref:alpha/beta hydrolase n=1 Tax=Rhizobium leguminosarum TaxID=384 RepID=UPI00040359A0|nr:alpha/beta hydrolase [Rhizobium leguminosarum]